jgi:TPR repeat protein
MFLRGKSSLVLLVAFILVVLTGCSSLQGVDVSVKDNPQLAKQKFRAGLDVTQGKGTEQDYKEGVELFKDAARNGSAKGAYLAGMSYLTGRGVAVDYIQSAIWLDLAAQKDHPAGLYELSVLYMNGRGVEKNRLWAGYLLSRAADLGHKQAMFDLGVVYARGLGLPQNLAAAWYWFAQAEKQGVALSKELKRRMYAKSNAGSRGTARRLMSYRSGVIDRSTTLFLQLRLEALGYSPGPADGIWGQKTKVSYRRFTQKEFLLSDLEINWHNLQMIRDY